MLRYVITYILMLHTYGVGHFNLLAPWHSWQRSKKWVDFINSVVLAWLHCALAKLVKSLQVQHYYCPHVRVTICLLL